MQNNDPKNYTSYLNNIRNRKLTIYDLIDITDTDLWIPAPILQQLLKDNIVGMSLSGLPLRTRSKVLKEAICSAMGYPIPKTFQKTKPRFVGQNFDTYIQKSNNLQIWNEEISPQRRYVIIQVGENDLIISVKVITGEELALLDKTGTLTQKYQARLLTSDNKSELITPDDTDLIKLVIANNRTLDSSSSPSDIPTKESLLPIKIIYDSLKSLIGQSFPDSGFDQERNRGSALHRIITKKLGYNDYHDNGKFPDIRNQLLEIKLQTSPTIDLGLVSPDSEEPIDIPLLEKLQLRHCDVRYALFYAVIEGKEVKLTHFYLTTGEGFFNRFPRFEGKVINKKLQIPLPKTFFSD